MARPPLYTDEELTEQAMKMQLIHPMLSEGAVCGKLKVGRQYIADRAKQSEVIQSLRDEMAALRQVAWEEHGQIMMLMSPKESNSVLYIWMTRNILGWRDRDSTQPEDKPVSIIPQVQLTTEERIEISKGVRGAKK